MNDTAIAKTIMSRRFVILWMLSLMVPGLILMVSRGAILGGRERRPGL